MTEDARPSTSGGQSPGWSAGRQPPQWGSRPQRDSRRSRVYAAEAQVERLLDRAAGGAALVDFFGSTLALPPERRFADLGSVQRWVDVVLSLDPVVRRWPGTPACRVRARRGTRRAHYQPPDEIAVPTEERWAMRELVLCHELAHHLVCHDGSVRADAAPHGREFVEAFVAVVDIVVGAEVALLLRAGLDEVGAR